MKNVNPYLQQTTQGIIGLDSNGKSVNMDLWEYTLNNETYALNDTEDIVLDIVPQHKIMQK